MIDVTRQLLDNNPSTCASSDITHLLLASCDTHDQCCATSEVIMIESSVGRGALWAALLQTGNGHHAPVLLSLDIRGPNDLVARADAVLARGVSKSELEAILAALTPPAPVAVAGRRDHPILVQHSGKASLTLALAAAQPNQRKRALEDLDRDVLARSTKPANDSRLRTFLALCGAWEVQAFPLSPVCIRCVGASFKAGCYTSAGIYFQTAVSHQLRVLGQPVSPFIRALIRDVVRSVRRGLGPATLKHGFDVTVLAKMIDPLDARPFSMDFLPHVADMMIISCWYMLREIEVSSARDSHLSLQGDEVQLLVPVHKTNTMGSPYYSPATMCLRHTRTPLMPVAFIRKASDQAFTTFTQPSRRISATFSPGQWHIPHEAHPGQVCA